MAQMQEMLFLNTKMYGVTVPVATLGLVVMNNMQICDSLPWMRMRMSLWFKKKVILKSNLLPLTDSAQSVWLYMQ